MIENVDKFLAELESLGEDEVRMRLSQPIYYNKDNHPLVREWLRGKEDARSSANVAKRDAREEETLSIAKEANEIASRALAIAERELSAAKSAASAAREQARWAKWAAIIATIAAIIATKDEIDSIISML